MIYHLFQLLKEYDIPGQGLMNYLSFRAFLASATAMLFSLLVGKKIIALLQRKQIGETVRDLGLQGQIEKKGTPTMGGVIIILSILTAVLLFCDLTNVYVLLLLLSTLWCGALGFTDDYIKVFKHNKEGMSEHGKLLAQILLGLVIGLTVWTSDDIVVREKVAIPEEEQEEIVESGRYRNEDVVKSTKTTIPFVKDHEFDYKWLSPLKGKWNWYTKWMIYVLMIVFVITACSNGTNLTDGLDGLAAGTSAIVGVVIGVLAWLGGNLIDSNYLNIMYIPGSQELVVFLCAFIGAMIGFLWYNAYPAQVFMGDTGSLTIGGIIGVCAVIIHKELLVPILCGIFLVESLSVMIQTFFFKYYKRKGQRVRIFRATPIHDNFRKLDSQLDETSRYVFKGWPKRQFHESKITVRFWIVTIILAALTIITLKIR